MRQTIKIECHACGATGVFSGFAEPKGVGVVCLECGGTGAKDFEYTPFTQRKQRKDISFVKRSRGSLVALGVGPTGGSVTYSDFLAGKMP